MEESKILGAYKALATHVHDFIKISNDEHAKTVNAINTHLARIKAASVDASTSFNASEQIQDLHVAQKELDLLLDDFLTLQEAGVLTESQYKMLQRYVFECDEVIRSMSDPEYS